MAPLQHIAPLVFILLNILHNVRTDIDALSWITDCDLPNRTKGCFRNPPTCTAFPKTEDDLYGDDKWCKIVVRWQQTFDTDSVNFEVYAPVFDRPESKYIAIGFSTSRDMKNSDVLACLTVDGKPQVTHSYNTVSHINEPQDLVGVRRVSGSFANGIFNCNFTRVKQIPAQNFFNDLNDKWYLLASRGPNAGGRISYHGEFKWSSSDKIDFSQYTADPDPTTQSVTDVAYRKTGHAGGFVGTPCSSNPCQNAGTCWDVANGFVCECYDHFAGRRCERDITGKATALSTSFLTVCLISLAALFLLSEM